MFADADILHSFFTLFAFPSALPEVMSQWIQTMRHDVLQGVSLVSTNVVATLRDSFNAFSAARHIDCRHLAPREFTNLLRETAVSIWLSEATQPEVYSS